MYHRQSIEVWLREELFAIVVHDHPNTQITSHLFTSATLVDFPEFPNIHHLIPQVLDLRPKHTTEHYYHEIVDSDKWKIYVKYRKVVSQFLNHQIHQASLSTFLNSSSSSRFLFDQLYFTGQERYVGLAKYLLSFLSEGL